MQSPFTNPHEYWEDVLIFGGYQILVGGREAASPDRCRVPVPLAALVRGACGCKQATTNMSNPILISFTNCDWPHHVQP